MDEEFLNEIYELWAEMDNAPAVINPEKSHQMDMAFEAAKYLAKKYGMNASIEKHKPFKTMGSITLSGKQVFTSEPNILVGIMRLASNTEVISMVDGTVQLIFTFHGIAKSLK